MFRLFSIALILVAQIAYGQTTIEEVDAALDEAADTANSGNTWYNYSGNAKTVANQVYGEGPNWEAFFANCVGPWADAAAAAIANGDTSFALAEQRRAAAIDPFKDTGTAKVILACNSRNGTPPPVSYYNALIHAQAAKTAYLSYWGYSCEAYDWYADAAVWYAEANYCAGRHYIRNGLFAYAESVEEESSEESDHIGSCETLSDNTWTQYNGAIPENQALAEYWMIQGDNALDAANTAFDLAATAYDLASAHVAAGDAAIANRDYATAEAEYAAADEELDEAMFQLNEVHIELGEAEDAYAYASYLLG